MFVQLSFRWESDWQQVPSLELHIFGPVNQQLAGLVKFDDISSQVKRLFTVVQSSRRPATLVYQATKNPLLLKTTKYIKNVPTRKTATLGTQNVLLFCDYYKWKKIGAFSRSLSTDLCDADMRLNQPRLQHKLKKHCKRALNWWKQPPLQHNTTISVWLLYNVWKTNVSSHSSCL